MIAPVAPEIETSGFDGWAVFQQYGDCYDTDEFTNPNGAFGDGMSCVLDCAD